MGRKSLADIAEKMISASVVWWHGLSAFSGKRYCLLSMIQGYAGDVIFQKMKLGDEECRIGRIQEECISSRRG